MTFNVWKDVKNVSKVKIGCRVWYHDKNVEMVSKFQKSDYTSSKGKTVDPSIFSLPASP